MTTNPKIATTVVADNKRVPLADSRCRSHPAPTGPGERTTLSDNGRGAVPGLQLRITSNGVRTFSVVYRPKGASKQQRKLVGRFGDKQGEYTLARARRAAMKIKSEVHEGANPQADHMREKRSPLVSEVYPKYVNYQKTQIATGDQVESRYNLHVKRTLGNLRMTEVKRPHLIKLLDDIPKNIVSHKKRGTRPGVAMVRRVKADLQGFFGWALDREYVQATPAVRIKVARQQPRQRALTVDELKAYMRTLATIDISTDLRDAMTLLVHSVQRVRQIGHLDWQFVNWNDDVIEWPAALMKGKPEQRRPFMLPMTDTIRALLFRRWEAQERPMKGLVFPSASGQPLKQASLHRGAHTAICRQVKLTDYTQHDHRTTFGSHLVEVQVNGMHPFDEIAVDIVLAHTSKTMAGKHYITSRYLDQKRTALRAWEQT